MTINGDKAVAWLRQLAVELENRGFSARVRVREGKPPHLNVINLAAPVLSEHVFVIADADGESCFYFPWPERIAPTSDVIGAAARIEHVLAEVGRSTEAADGHVRPPGETGEQTQCAIP